MVEDALTVTEANLRSAAGIAAFRDHPGLRAALQAELGADIPATPGFVQAGGIILSCLSPTRYLATGPRDSNLPARFSQRLQDLAAITDQSDLWHVVTCSGPLVRECLARLVPIDLRPETFPIGGLALTRAGHIDIRLWRLAATAYEVAVARSYAKDVRYLLQMEASARS